MMSGQPGGWRVAMATVQNPSGQQQAEPVLVDVDELPAFVESAALGEMEAELHALEQRLANFKQFAKDTRVAAEQGDERAQRRLEATNHRLAEMEAHKRQFKQDLDAAIVAQKPAPLTRLRNYSQAALEWQAAGRPERTQEQIDELIAVCRKCEIFDTETEVCQHKACGCSVTRPKIWGYKLKWATQHCPIGKW